MKSTYVISEDTARSCFKRDDLRGLWPGQFNAEVARATGAAFCQLLQRDGALKPAVVLGHDARMGSAELLSSFAAGVRECGGTVVSLGLASTEQVYYAAGRYADTYQGGAMITASHNPSDYNGAKMIRSGAIPLSTEDFQFVKERLLKELMPAPSWSIGAEYAEYVLALSGMDSLPPQRLPLKIVVAAGNGVGAMAFRPVAEELASKGLQTIWLDAEPDGTFPNGVPNPLLPDFNRRLADAVLANQADLGIGFDGDADRAGFVDQRGLPVNASYTMALVTRRKLSRMAPSGETPVVMRNICCSQLLKHLFPAGGDVELVDSAVGHAQFKRLMHHDAYQSRVIFAGEHSGHYFYPDFFCADSGMLTALHLIGIVWQFKQEGKTLSDMLEDWRSRYLWSGELNFDLDSREELLNAMRDVNAAYGSKCQRDEVRVSETLGLNCAMPAVGQYRPESMEFPDLKLISDNGKSGWWFVLRPSGNEPKLRLNVETWNLPESELERLTKDIIAILVRHGARAS